MKSIRRHLSYANVVATMALVFAMSGSAIAARHYLITSTKQISPKVLKSLRGRAGASGLRGPAGIQGTLGPQGPVGPATGPAGGDLTGSYPNPTIRASAVTHADIKTDICGYSSGTFGESSTCPLEVGQVGAGVLCLVLPFAPTGGSVTLDAADSGFPTAFLSFDPVEIAKAGCAGVFPGGNANVLLTTFAGSSNADEGFHAIFF